MLIHKDTASYHFILVGKQSAPLNPQTWAMGWARSTLLSSRSLLWLAASSDEGDGRAPLWFFSPPPAFLRHCIPHLFIKNKRTEIHFSVSEQQKDGSTHNLCTLRPPENSLGRTGGAAQQCWEHHLQPPLG